MFDGGKMMARAWLHQLHTYFTLNPSMVDEDAMHFASLHLEGDARVVVAWHCELGVLTNHHV